MSCLKIALAVLVLSATSLVAQTIDYIYIGETTSPLKLAAFGIRSDGSSYTVSGSPFIAAAYSIAASANYVFVTGGKKITTYRRSSTGALSSSSQVDALSHSVGSIQWGVMHLTLDRTAGRTRLMARDTVAVETLARRAISRIFMCSGV
jgi:hypothetical protein